MILYLDFETRSKANLRAVGAYRYAEDPSTEVLLAAVAVDGAPVERLGRLEARARLPALIARAEYVVAHNAEFERQILAEKFGLRLPPSKFRCTSAQAARMGLPRHLGKACAALGLAEQKDDRGKRLVQKFSKPRKPSKSNPEEFWDAESAPEDWSDFEDYNAQDVEAMRALHRALPPLEASEQALWELTVAMNEAGLAVDGMALAVARGVAAEAEAELTAKFVSLVGVRPTQVEKARAALGVKSLAKAEVRRALRGELPPPVREALLLRQAVAKSSVKKLAALTSHKCLDGRLRGSLIYCGAERTGRWSGGGVQLQNLPRGLGEGTDEAFEALLANALPLLYEAPLRTISEMLKGFFVGPFFVGDFAQVEARVLAWLAGQRDLLADFASGADVYCSMASAIYGEPVSKADFDEELRIAKRQLGKVAVLGCGYGLGAAKLRVQLDEVFNVVAEQALCERTVEAYRARYPRIPAFWRLLERGFAQAIERRASRIRVGPVLMGYREFGGRPFAFIELPSGRRLWYFSPEVRDGESWYYGRNIYAGGRWQAVSTYGGKLAENVVQGVARDLLAEAVVRFARRGFKLALTVHDEIVAFAVGGATIEEFQAGLVELPPWGAGLPMAAESFETRRYRK